MLLQWRDASAPRFGRAAARLPKALDPDNCGAGTNRKFLGLLAPRSSTFDLRNHSLPHLPRIGLWHRPASQKRINADSLSHPRPHENPPDSIGAEHALVQRKVAVIVLLVNPMNAYTEPETRATQAAARTLGLRLDVVNAINEIDFDAAFATL